MVQTSKEPGSLRVASQLTLLMRTMCGFRPHMWLSCKTCACGLPMAWLPPKPQMPSTRAGILHRSSYCFCTLDGSGTACASKMNLRKHNKPHQHTIRLCDIQWPPGCTLISTETGSEPGVVAVHVHLNGRETWAPGVVLAQNGLRAQESSQMLLGAQPPRLEQETTH